MKPSPPTDLLYQRLSESMQERERLRLQLYEAEQSNNSLNQKLEEIGAIYLNAFSTLPEFTDKDIAIMAQSALLQIAAILHLPN